MRRALWTIGICLSVKELLESSSEKALISYRIVSYREKTLILYRYRIESKKSLSLMGGRNGHEDKSSDTKVRLKMGLIQ